MGLEAPCAATLDGETSRGKALLETTELVFRATEGPLRARVPLAEVKAVTVAGTTLTLKWRGGTLSLDLGAAAARWAAKIEPPPSLLSKLGIKRGARVALVGAFSSFDPRFGPSVEEAGAVMTARGAVDVLVYAPAKRAR